MIDARWTLGEHGELWLASSLAQTDASMGTLVQLPAFDLPLSFFPDGLPGPGDDPTAPLPDHDYDFTSAHDYSNLDYVEWRSTLGVRGRVRPGLDLFATVSLYDLEDDEPYLQDATGSVTLVSGGLTWSF